MRKIGTLLLLLLAAGSAGAALREQTVRYGSGGTPLQGYLVWDDAVEGRRPGVLVVHEFWGLNDYARSRARQLARLGYTAFALDLYGDGKAATHPGDATAFMRAVMARADVMQKRFVAAQTVLQQEESVDPGRIAAIGYCFGGYVVLQMARAGVPLRAVASFHGMLDTDRPAAPGAIAGKVAVFNGADDKMVSPESIAAFRQEMQHAGVDYEFVAYPGARHGFTNPEADAIARRFDLPVAYDAAADQDSWQRLQQLLATAFAR